MADSYSPLTVAQIQKIGHSRAFQSARSSDQHAMIRQLAAIYALGEIECAVLMQADRECYDRYGRPRS